MGKLPAILLYDGDWYKDGVAGCSLQAQGLWLRMIFIGHNSERYGYLQVNGLPIPPESIARRCGCTLGEYESYLLELDRNGVPSRTPEGIIYSRRLVKDAQERAKATARKQKERSRVGHNSVTPLSVDVNEDVVVVGSRILKPDYKPAFLLEDFDPQQRFSELCDVYPKPNRSILGMQSYQRAIESCVSTNRPDRNEIASAIEQAAAAYTQAKRGSAKQFIPQLIAWLDKGIWQQDPAMWEETVGTPKQRALANGIDEAFS